VPADKIFLSRNGIDPEKFKFEKKEKNPNKVVFMSSPDRGLDRAMLICDKLLKKNSKLELHVYYGLDNLYKYGLADMAEKLKAMMAERPYVHYHGFVEQSKMYYEVSDAVCLIHACTFIETFMITALEMLALGIFTVARSLGAITNTLADANLKGQCILLESLDLDLYEQSVQTVLDNNLWEKVNCDLNKYSWESVAQEWIKEMQL
jgi:glycosyltransferase involved in cell wall biosynthesis